MSEAYDPDNLLDRHTPRATMELQYEHMFRREAELLGRHLGMSGGDVVSVGCGWHPGRHAFPAPAWRMTGVDVEEERPRYLLEQGAIDEGMTGRAGELPFEPAELRRGALSPGASPHRVRGAAGAFLRGGGAPAAAGRRPGCGGAGALHPVGAGLGAANALGLGNAVHGTPDDVPLWPGALMREARAAGSHPSCTP